MSILKLRALVAPNDVPKLQEVLEAAPNYAMNISGVLQPRNAGEEIFIARPDGFDLENKFILGIEDNGEVIGCIDVLRGFPRAEAAMLGLLLLAEKQQKKGRGKMAYLLLEDVIRKWPEIKTVRIGVIGTNIEVLGFWTRLGFKEVEARRPYERGTVKSEIIVLEKPLA